MRNREVEKSEIEMIEASPAKLLVFQSFGDRDNECQDNSSPQEYRKAECQNEMPKYRCSRWSPPVVA
jgi:hypothetical protein